MNCYPFIEAEKAQQRNVKRACELLKVSRAAYYAARDGQPSDRDRQDAELTVLIKAEHKRSKGRYGAPRIHAELRRQGRRHSRKRIARLMRQAGLAGRAPRRWKKTTIPDPAAAARGRCDPPGLHHRRRQGQPAAVWRHHLPGHLGRVALPISSSSTRTRGGSWAAGPPGR